ncbi:hypothetical protein IMZ48_02200 [Candidatus Bathyarchaeota archaeon]|nr:hypothetical protein [Candidatus Bathyarchaeota archaeon]
MPWLTQNPHLDTFPSVDSTGDWEVVRKTDNFQSNGPVTDVTGGLMTCYQTTMDGNVGVLDVKAGSTVNYNAKSAVSHPGPMNVYIAKAPAGTAIEDFDGTGAVWMKVWGYKTPFDLFQELIELRIDPARRPDILGRGNLLSVRERHVDPRQAALVP